MNRSTPFIDYYYRIFYGQSTNQRLHQVLQASSLLLLLLYLKSSMAIIFRPLSIQIAA